MADKMKLEPSRRSKRKADASYDTTYFDIGDFKKYFVNKKLNVNLTIDGNQIGNNTEVLFPIVINTENKEIGIKSSLIPFSNSNQGPLFEELGKLSKLSNSSVSVNDQIDIFNIICTICKSDLFKNIILYNFVKAKGSIDKDDILSSFFKNLIVGPESNSGSISSPFDAYVNTTILFIQDKEAKAEKVKESDVQEKCSIQKPDKKKIKVKRTILNNTDESLDIFRINTLDQILKKINYIDFIDKFYKIPDIQEEDVPSTRIIKFQYETLYNTILDRFDKKFIDIYRAQLLEYEWYLDYLVQCEKDNYDALEGKVHDEDVMNLIYSIDKLSTGEISDFIGGSGDCVISEMDIEDVFEMNEWIKLYFDNELNFDELQLEFPQLIKTKLDGLKQKQNITADPTPSAFSGGSNRLPRKKLIMAR